MEGGRPWPFAERPESVPRMGGGCHAIERPAISSLPSPSGSGAAVRVVLLWGNINRRNLYRATNDAFDAIGFLVCSAASGRVRSLLRSELLREDVSTRAPAGAGSGQAACATILVIGPALVVLYDHGSPWIRSAASLSPVTSVSALMLESIVTECRLQAESAFQPPVGNLI